MNPITTYLIIISFFTLMILCAISTFKSLETESVGKATLLITIAFISFMAAVSLLFI